MNKNRELYPTGFEPTGSPFFYSLLGTFQTGQFDFDYRAFQVVSTILFTFGLLLLCFSNRLSIWNSFLMLFIFFIFFRPLHIDYTVANVNRIQIFLFGLYSWMFVKERFWIAGIVLGISIAFKLNFLLVAILAIATVIGNRKDFGKACRFAVGIALGMGFAFLYGVAWFGQFESWLQWRSYVKEFLATIQPMDAGNYSIQHLSQTNVSIAPLVLSLALALAIGFRVIKSCDKRSGQMNSSLGLLVFLLSSPLVWTHYFVLAIPIMINLIGQLIAQRSLFAVGLLAIGFVLTSGQLAAWLTPLQITIMLQTGAIALLLCALFVQLRNPDKLVVETQS